MRVAEEKTVPGGEAAGWEQVDLYRFFAHVLGAPSAERFRWFQQPELAAALARLWAELDCAGEFPGLNIYRDYGEYESTYIAIFDVGVPGPPVPLLESAHNKTQPAQQIALENTFFYDVLGLKADPTRTAPDHLLIQLEFLSVVHYVCEHTTEEENRGSLARLEREFLERHLLDWLPAAQKKLDRLAPPLFPVLLTLLLAFLRQQHRRLAT